MARAKQAEPVKETLLPLIRKDISRPYNERNLAEYEGRVDIDLKA